MAAAQTPPGRRVVDIPFQCNNFLRVLSVIVVYSFPASRVALNHNSFGVGAFRSKTNMHHFGIN